MWASAAQKARMFAVSVCACGSLSCASSRTSPPLRKTFGTLDTRAKAPTLLFAKIAANALECTRLARAAAFSLPMALREVGAWNTRKTT